MNEKEQELVASLRQIAESVACPRCGHELALHFRVMSDELRILADRIDPGPVDQHTGEDCPA